MENGKPKGEESTEALSYWDVLKPLHGHLEQADAVLDEAAPGESPEDALNRRDLLKFMAASISLAGLSACRRPVEKILPFVDPPERMVPGVPRHYATTMPLAQSSYGLVVKSVDGRPIKIEGNPNHPSTAGASSVLMQAAILGLYDPDRSQSVRHDGKEKTWDEFVAAWQTSEAIHLQSGGSGLAVLGESFSSPTLTRLKTAFLTRFPGARWATFDPTSDENAIKGVELATGGEYQPVCSFDKAKVILSLDADFLLTDTESVANARGFAVGRRVTSAKDSMNRLYVAESGYSLTGANADHRLRIQSRGVGRLAVELLAKLQKHGLAIEAPAGIASGKGAAETDHWIEVVARDLVAHRGEGLIIAGRQQPPEVHALVFALNHALGNVGTAVTYHESQDRSYSALEELRKLVAAMNSGAISTLVILGGNPVYNAPVDFDFAAALKKVRGVIHLSPYVDETSRVATWHVPETHFLEAWGDARAVGGQISVVQPLIRPLFGAKSAVEVLSVIAGEPAVSGYDQVRSTWRASIGETDFDSRWDRVLHDGLLAGSALPSVTTMVRPTALAEAVAKVRVDAGPLEIVFRQSPTVFDGRFANNGWLQELPDAITKLTWDNVAVMSPKTAIEQGVRNEDLVRIQYRGRAVETPVWIVPGHADNSVSVTLGYGRTSVGRVGNNVGVNMYSIRTSEAPDIDGGIKLEKTGRKHPLAGTQDHTTMEGRAIVRQASLAHYREKPDFAHEHGAHDASAAQIYKDPVDWKTGYQWGMSIDLSSCTGCNACVVACQSENNVPIVGKEQVKRGREMHWLRLDRYFTGIAHAGTGKADDPQLVFQPMPCQHCETAPCEQVCPVGATTHDSEGLNVMVYNRCIGTRYCSNNCPYKVRRFNWFDLTSHMPEVMKLAQNPDVTVRSRGVMEKCTFCLQRISSAKKKAKREGHEVRDGDVKTACQQSCPVTAIQFGRIDDPASLVTQNKSSDRNYDLLGEINTRPRVSYLAKLRNPHPELTSRDEEEH